MGSLGWVFTVPGESTAGVCGQRFLELHLCLKQSPGMLAVSGGCGGAGIIALDEQILCVCPTAGWEHEERVGEELCCLLKVRDESWCRKG